MNLLRRLEEVGVSTLLDILPIVIVIFVFQILVVRKLPPSPRRVAIGFIYVVVGLTLFLIGLKEALFPLGRTMAQQLTSPEFLGIDVAQGLDDAARAVRWQDFGWLYAFAAAVAFATTIAEPALIAVANKAAAVSGGTINVWGLRVAVAIGVSVGVTLGAFRIVIGAPLHYFIMAGYAVLIVQTMFSRRDIIPLAYDSGGVSTSTVTVPLVTALGLGLASNIPGRSPLIDGFGLIAFACLFPIIAVLGYAQLSTWRARRAAASDSKERT